MQTCNEEQFSAIPASIYEFHCCVLELTADIKLTGKIRTHTNKASSIRMAYQPNGWI